MLLDPRFISVIVGILVFAFALFLARNKRTRFIMAVSAGLCVGTISFIFVGQQTNELRLDNPFLLTALISAVLAITIFINDRFHHPLVHYASLLGLLFFSVYVAGIFFPSNFYDGVQEGIALEILAGGYTTFLIFLTIDSFNDQDADDRHTELMNRIDKLQAHIDQLELHSKKTLHG